MSWLTHRRSWRSEFVCCLAAGCSMATDAVARFRRRRLVFRLLPRLLHQVDQTVQRRRRHRFELAFGCKRLKRLWLTPTSARLVGNQNARRPAAARSGRPGRPHDAATSVNVGSRAAMPLTLAVQTAV